jgi:hypothetical protein
MRLHFPFPPTPGSDNGNNGEARAHAFLDEGEGTL